MKMPINSPTAICQCKNFVYIISPDFLFKRGANNRGREEKGEQKGKKREKENWREKEGRATASPLNI